MSDSLRVPLRPRRGAEMLRLDDIAASIGMTAKYGRRFSLDIAEDALATMAAEAIPYFVDQLVKDVVWREQGAVSSILHREFLTNRKWTESILYEAMKPIAREYVTMQLERIDLENRIDKLEARLTALEPR